MSTLIASQVLFYLIKRSVAFTNSGLSSSAGTIWLNSTEIAVTDMSVAATIEAAINAELGAGEVTVTLATETFTITFNTGRYYNVKVYILTAEQTVTDTTTPTADQKIATQTNLGLDRIPEFEDATNKDSDGWNEQEAVGKEIGSTLENIYATDDDNYQYLVDAADGFVDLMAYLALASGNFWCRVSVSAVGEAAPEKGLVRSTITWKSNGGYTPIT